VQAQILLGAPYMKTYTQKLNKWFEEEKKENGLIDFKIFVFPDSNVTVESLAKEIWEMIHAPKRLIGDNEDKL
jgi:hypothetical protein